MARRGGMTDGAGYRLGARRDSIDGIGGRCAVALLFLSFHASAGAPAKVAPGCVPSPPGRGDVLLSLEEAGDVCLWTLVDPVTREERRLVDSRAVCPEVIVFDGARRQIIFVHWPFRELRRIAWRRGAEVESLAHLPHAIENDPNLFISAETGRVRVSGTHRLTAGEWIEAEHGWRIEGQSIKPSDFDDPELAAIAAVVEAHGGNWKPISVAPVCRKNACDDFAKLAAAAADPKAKTLRSLLIDTQCRRGECEPKGVPDDVVERIERALRLEGGRWGWLRVPTNEDSSAAVVFGTLTVDSVFPTPPVVLCRHGCREATPLQAEGPDANALDWRTLAGNRQLTVEARGGYVLVAPAVLSGDAFLYSGCGGQPLLEFHQSVVVWAPLRELWETLAPAAPNGHP
jgi:hypothetical protein